jgi:hypothetical protein
MAEQAHREGQCQTQGDTSHREGGTHQRQRGTAGAAPALASWLVKPLEKVGLERASVTDPTWATVIARDEDEHI